MSLLSVDFEGGKRKNVELMIPPPGALDDFWEV